MTRIRWLRAVCMLGLITSVVLCIAGVVHPVSIAAHLGSRVFRIDTIAGRITLTTLSFETTRDELSMDIQSVQWIHDKPQDDVLYTLTVHTRGHLDQVMHAAVWPGYQCVITLPRYFTFDVHNHSCRWVWPTAGMLVVWIWLWWPVIRDRRRTRDGRCVRCGYDLRASPERCPECGEAVIAQC